MVTRYQAWDRDCVSLTLAGRLLARRAIVSPTHWTVDRLVELKDRRVHLLVDRGVLGCDLCSNSGPQETSSGPKKYFHDDFP
jgi:hypothetical protein